MKNLDVDGEEGSKDAMQLDMDLVKTDENSYVSGLKEKMYDNYNSNASKRGVKNDDAPLIGASSNKPKFLLNMGKIPGVTPQASTGPSLTEG